MKPTNLLIALVVCAPVAVSAETLLRAEGMEGMRGLPMRLDGRFVGVVGDAVVVTPVSHRLIISLPLGLDATYEILARDGHIHMTSVMESHCLGSTSWSVGSSTTLVVHQDADGYSVKLPMPEVRLEGLCPIELPNLNCMWREVGLQIHAIPEVGAEVWIDGVRLSGVTSKELSLGYCAGTSPHVAFLLRKAGYTTCFATVAIEDEHEHAPHDIGCVLRPL